MASKKLPAWVNQQIFVELLQEQFKDFSHVENFAVKAAISDGENYLTIVLRIAMDMHLQDGSNRHISYILKIPLINDRGYEHDYHLLFVNEAEMHERIVPELEALYVKRAELQLRFKPPHARFPRQPADCDYILMEDLRPQGYSNLDRLTGLSQLQVEAVLKKLAQWHAASAQRVLELGDYCEGYRSSYFGTESRQQLEQQNMSFNLPFLECMQQYNLGPGALQLLTNYMDRLTDLYIEFGRVQANDFNVLNHGDFWCNNFMFKHNDEGTIVDVCFVDFQLPKYGTPAQDLLCLLMTTPNINIKLKKFDDFIVYYYEQLVAHLKLLNYTNKIPTLPELQANLRKHSVWAFVCAQRILPVALYPPSSESNLENYMSDSATGMAFKRQLLLNPSYVQQIKLILPWLMLHGYIN